MCMIGYLLVKECKEEAFTCTCIFLLSILFIVIGYEPVVKQEKVDTIDRSSVAEADTKE